MSLCLALSGCSKGGKGASTQQLTYPEPPRAEQVDDYHGTQVADPYRPLEDMNSDATKRWVAQQNALAQPFLEAIPARERFKARMTELWNYERYDVPVKAGSRYFYLRNDG